MRWIANIPNPQNDLKRLMLYDSPEGIYLFGYNSTEDCSAAWDEWYEDSTQAKATAAEEYGVVDSAWKQIADPLPGCQQDFIAPVRVKGRNEGKPEWGQMEVFVDGTWKSME